MITAQMVKELREKTGAGMMDCKRALEETNGDIEKAIDFLREKVLLKQKQTELQQKRLCNFVIDGNTLSYMNKLRDGLRFKTNNS